MTLEQYQDELHEDAIFEATEEHYDNFYNDRSFMFVNKKHQSTCLVGDVEDINFIERKCLNNVIYAYNNKSAKISYYTDEYLKASFFLNNKKVFTFLLRRSQSEFNTKLITEYFTEEN